MSIHKTNKPELLIKFNETENAKQLDEMIYQFEKNINNKKEDYFLKESENPYIFFLEYPKPQELIKEIENENIKTLETIVPVECVINNTNYITSTILRKIRHKITYHDTFNITCHVDSYIPHRKEKLEKELKSKIQDILAIPIQKNNPIWNINIHIIGEVSAINIERSNKNRNKYSQYNNYC
ncbi:MULTISPECIES: hypothetical protein [Methanosphaera]|uniref:THUMP domain-containing protein n=2 Tax=Methanosphaera stadtmanae TaxID=2317 RepID=Q2NI55_METST|nr:MULTISPECIES: hypothetical protein [Methanosphaera]ABC56496.1 hypothetical protein Msp_0077 [Methanosphaera stadtmanae DSM 3091]MDO5822533.1 hypothetical protein [Methanosphaera sp.]MEE0489021.1 hypothetical protein [Methanosphaera stadtmanae]OEC90162.1 hypothetical protein A9758_00135 [Methanosphaera sp. A6]RAP03778.1 hypothetical protein CA615_00385 [Methanosphaera stadtmanae]